MGVQLPPLAPFFLATLFFLCSFLARAAAIIRLTNQAEGVRPPNAEISKGNTIFNPAAGNFMLPETAQGVDLKYSLLTTCRTASFSSEYQKKFPQD